MWYDSMVNNFFLSKGNKDRKNITHIAWENKEQKIEMTVRILIPIILALLIGQEAILSLTDSDKDHQYQKECFQWLYSSSCILLLWHFASGL